MPLYFSRVYLNASYSNVAIEMEEASLLHQEAKLLESYIEEND